MRLSIALLGLSCYLTRSIGCGFRFDEAERTEESAFGQQLPVAEYLLGIVVSTVAHLLLLYSNLIDHTLFVGFVSPRPQATAARTHQNSYCL